MPTVALLAGRNPAHRHSLHRGYADAVWSVGATPVVLVPPPSPAGIRGYVSAAMACDAVCVTGGGDVDPARYGGDPGGASALTDLDPARDDAELACVVAARTEGRPLLGICRGIQVITVALGGKLHPDLPTAGFAGHWDEGRQHEPVHPITSTPGSLSEAALCGADLVNSIHHQAVAAVGPSLVATAWGPDGVIEAIEAPGVLGVQWHPERLFESDARHLGPFRWLACTGAGTPA
jgi:putative glutamine amidotransferase